MTCPIFRFDNHIVHVHLHLFVDHVISLYTRLKEGFMKGLLCLSILRLSLCQKVSHSLHLTFPRAMKSATTFLSPNVMTIGGKEIPRKERLKRTSWLCQRICLTRFLIEIPDINKIKTIRFSFSNGNTLPWKGNSLSILFRTRRGDSISSSSPQGARPEGAYSLSQIEQEWKDSLQYLLHACRVGLLKLQALLTWGTKDARLWREVASVPGWEKWLSSRAIVPAEAPPTGL